MNKEINKDSNKTHHIIEEINSHHNPVSEEPIGALLQNTPDRLGNAYGYNVSTLPNPFPFTEEEDDFGKLDEFGTTRDFGTANDFDIDGL
jgi:hypothetical protein